MEKYAGRRATELLRIAEQKYAVEEVYDSLGEALDSYEVSKAPFTLTMTCDSLDEAERKKIIDNIEEFSEFFKKFIDTYRLVFADSQKRETTVEDVSFSTDGKDLKVAIDKISYLPEIEPIAVKLSAENLEVIKRFIESKLKESKEEA